MVPASQGYPSLLVILGAHLDHLVLQLHPSNSNSTNEGCSLSNTYTVQGPQARDGRDLRTVHFFSPSVECQLGEAKVYILNHTTSLKYYNCLRMSVAIVHKIQYNNTMEAVKHTVVHPRVEHTRSCIEIQGSKKCHS